MKKEKSENQKNIEDEKTSVYNDQKLKEENNKDKIVENEDGKKSLKDKIINQKTALLVAGGSLAAGTALGSTIHNTDEILIDTNNDNIADAVLTDENEDGIYNTETEIDEIEAEPEFEANNESSSSQTFNIDAAPHASDETITDDMSFSEAFGAAREELGAGGVFEWNGQQYGTFYENEVDENHNPTIDYVTTEDADYQANTENENIETIETIETENTIENNNENVEVESNNEVIEQETDNEVVDVENNNEVIEQETDNEVVEVESNNEVIEQDEDNNVFDNIMETLENTNDFVENVGNVVESVGNIVENVGDVAENVSEVVENVENTAEIISDIAEPNNENVEVETDNEVVEVENNNEVIEQVADNEILEVESDNEVIEEITEVENAEDIEEIVGATTTVYEGAEQYDGEIANDVQDDVQDSDIDDHNDDMTALNDDFDDMNDWA